MKLKTSSFLLDKKKELRQIIDELGKEFEYVSILGTDVTGQNFAVRTSGMNVSPSNDEERGFVVRVMQDSGVTEYSFNDLCAEHVCAAV
ncbi:MAG: TldD/PmbA family protein, partial [Bacillota bacterium]|nr:TldD/PmbA family protein [Bacillota bacterium]